MRNKDSLSEIIFNFLNKDSNPALFAGAGVGAIVGYPTWIDFLEHLAKIANKYEPIVSELIRKRTRSGDFINAANEYKTCPEIPEGEKYRQLAILFEESKADSDNILKDLVSLNFKAIFTTNYDRSLLDACAVIKRKSITTIELNDPIMRRAPYIKDFYVARLHGRAEVPESIVISTQDYEKLNKNDLYIDFLKHILTMYSCLFLGFSFIDPSINQIFSFLENKLSPNFPKLHLAIIPSNSDPRLKEKLMLTH